MRAIIAPATGIVDGMNMEFDAASAYVPGSLQVFLNGQLKRVDYDDGWKELGGSRFLLKEPPIPGDVVEVYFIAL